jgi:fructokinase
MAGSIIIYDPNFRKPHINKLSELKPNIIRNIESADIIRGSDEDFKSIFGTDNLEETLEFVNNKVLIYTMGREGAWLSTPNYKKHFHARNIEAVSTIGAGDSFNAAIAYSLFKMEIHKKNLPNLIVSDWDCIINAGLELARAVCLSAENYIDQAFALGFDRNFSSFCKLFRK